ncbi:MAG TPA: adenylate/guanylate cyclase domain-containing protein [Steroidobacter sp.]
MAHTWNRSRANERITHRLEEVRDVTVLDFTRDMSLENIPVNRAYRMHAVHLYADIVNLDEMLNATQEEGVDCHRRTMRFLNQHYRAVHRILKECDAQRVDFHNQRLHAVVYKPYGAESEKTRVDRAVAIADLIMKVLDQTGDSDEKIPAARVRVGIDTGRALVVNNGRSGNREPLFLGRPANHAAHLAGHDQTTGIFLSNPARKAIGLEELKDGKEFTTKLTRAEIEDCVERANLAVSKDRIVEDWRQDLKDNPIGTFEFTRPTPPLRTLEIKDLTPKNSRRFEATSVYADVDGFTAYVDRHLASAPENVVRCFHVIRAELDAALSSDFEGRRVRFIGDSLHGALFEGTARETDPTETISTMTLCAGALRSSFDLSLERLQQRGIDVANLGLQVGFEYGPLAISRLGMQGDRVRCCVGRAVVASEDEQLRCKGNETALGQTAYDVATAAVRKLFGTSRKVASLTYDIAVEALAAEGDKVAKAAFDEQLAVSAPIMLKRPEATLRPHSLTP